ncbi:Endopolyphosphatase, partial [Dipsacomyces acuminosporus]
PADEYSALLHARWLEQQHQQHRQQQHRQQRMKPGGVGTWVVIGVATLAALAVITMGYITVVSDYDSDPLPDPNGTRLDSPSVGRFLHITDMHVDPYYLEGSTTYSSCHRKPLSSPLDTAAKGRKGDKDGHLHTGRFGLPTAKCDSPIALINATSKYLKSEWSRLLDFVIWTGDSGRHDNDNEIPRTFKEIIKQNYITSGALSRAFGDLPIVPNIGNNDISPHNELSAPGHKRARKTFKLLGEAWKDFIPEDQLNTFLYGGYFAKDVMEYSSGSDDSSGNGGLGTRGLKKIPKHKNPSKRKQTRQSKGLTALSLNTIYWYRANEKVGGCKADDSPGLAQLAWIRYQVRRARERNRDLIILGHVVPNRDNYRPTCYHGYARTVTQVVPAPALHSGLKDDDDADLPIVHAQLFGHSNVDVWSFVGQEVEWLQSNYGSNVTDDSGGDDKRLWWEREIDEESGYFGKLIRDVWSASSPSGDSLVSTLVQAERGWEDMEDDSPDVHFVEDASGSIWPSSAEPAKASNALPGDFIDTLLKEFERVLVQPRIPRMG